MQKTKKKLRKYGEIGILLAFKESYLFFKNIFGLKVHPFQTLRAMQREKDRSQQLLIIGLPVYVLGLGTMLVWLGRRLLGTSIEWGMAAKIISLMVLIITGMIGGYLGYWVVRVWRAKYE